MGTIKVYEQNAIIQNQYGVDAAIHTGIEFEFGGNTYQVRGGSVHLGDGFKRLEKAGTAGHPPCLNETVIVCNSIHARPSS